MSALGPEGTLGVVHSGQFYAWAQHGFVDGHCGQSWLALCHEVHCVGPCWLGLVVDTVHGGGGSIGFGSACLALAHHVERNVLFVVAGL